MAGEMLPGFPLDILGFTGQDGVATGAITVNGTGTAWSKSFPLRRGMTFGWDVQFTSVGTINVKVELEQCFARPTTEQLVDAVHCVIPDNKSASPMFAAVTDALLHNTAYSPNATAFGRLKFTGLAGNNAATQCTLARVYQIKNF